MSADAPLPNTAIATYVAGSHSEPYSSRNSAFAGTISYISPRAEYTPPVIYSRESRAKLVFLVEIHFDPAIAAKLHPGQPVDVRFVGQ